MTTSGGMLVGRIVSEYHSQGHDASGASALGGGPRRWLLGLTLPSTQAHA